MHIIKFNRILSVLCPKQAHFNSLALQRIRQIRRTILELKSRVAMLEGLQEKTKSFHVDNTLLRFNIKPHQTRHRIQVLIVEDNETYLEQFKGRCEKASEIIESPIDVITTREVTEAFTLIETNVFDIILSDINVINGKMDEVLSVLKRNIESKVLIVSSYPESVFRGRDEAFYDVWLSKNFNPEALVPHLEKRIGLEEWAR